MSERTNQQILEQAITKAIDGGWKPPLGDVEVSNQSTWPHDAGEIFAYYGAYSMPQWMMIIFNHNFARALWPDVPYYKLVCPRCESNYNWWDKAETKSLGFPPSRYCNSDGTKLKKTEDHYSSPWRQHLQQMVIADDRIKYLGEHLS